MNEQTESAALRDEPVAPEDDEIDIGALTYLLAVHLMRLDGNDGDPHTLLWCGGTVPEPWGDAWQRYEPQAQSVINAIGESSAQAMVTSLDRALKLGDAVQAAEGGVKS